MSENNNTQTQLPSAIHKSNNSHQQNSNQIQQPQILQSKHQTQATMSTMDNRGVAGQGAQHLLDQSQSAASADSSMIKSWISIKDLKQMVNPQSTTSSNQNQRKSKIKQPTVIANVNHQEKERSKEDYPLQINSRRNLNAPLQSMQSDFQQKSTATATSTQSQLSAEKLKKVSTHQKSQSTLKTARLQTNPSQTQLTKQQQQQVQQYQNSNQANKENRSIDKHSQNQPLFKKQTMFRNQSFVKSQRSIDRTNQAVNMKLKQLEIDISDQNDQMIANDSMLLVQNEDSQIQNQGVNNSDQLNCILDTYDKDYEEFQEHLDKMKQHLRINTAGTTTTNGAGSLGDSQYQQSQGSGRTYNSKKNTNRSLLQDKQFESQHLMLLSKSQHSAYQDQFCNQITTEAICSPKIIIQNLESKKTSKRNSDMMNTMSQLSNQDSLYQDLSVKVLTSQPISNIQSKRNLPNLKECNSQSSMGSNIQTEKRCDAKLVIKLKNDIELLNELLQEEKDRNTDLQSQLQNMQAKLNAQSDENQTLTERIEQLEFQLQEVSTELVNTKDYYEEMIQTLQTQIQVMNNKENISNKEHMENMMNLFSKIQQNTNNTESFKLSCDMSRGCDQTLQELSNQFNQTLNKDKQNKKFDILKKLVNNVSYQNKSNNFSMNSSKNNQQQYATIKLNKVQESQDLMNDTSMNNSNILMTSECKQNQNPNLNHQYVNSDISASLSQYDNQNVKFLKYVNKSKLIDTSNSYYGNSHCNVTNSNNKNPNVSRSGLPMKKRQAFKLSKMMNQSSIVEGDDSVICEEAVVQANNIKTGHFHINKLDDLPQQPSGQSQPNLINIQEHPFESSQLEASPIEDQINSLLHQIDGHLLTQSVELLPQNSSRAVLNNQLNENGVADSQQFIVQNHQNLATFGGHQQVAQSLTGTQQLSLLWNNLKDDEREFYSKRISFSNNNYNEGDGTTSNNGGGGLTSSRLGFTGFNINMNYDNDESQSYGCGLGGVQDEHEYYMQLQQQQQNYLQQQYQQQYGNNDADSSQCLSPNQQQIEEEQMQMWLQNRDQNHQQQEQQHQQYMLQNIEISLAKFRDPSKQ